MSKRIVIDASVSQAAGHSDDLRAKGCREAMTEILEVCHRAVFTSELLDEWRRHSSKFSQGWLAAMTSRRKIVRVGSTDIDIDLDSACEAGGLRPKETAAALKDGHLVVGALQADRRILSLDERARGAFQALCEQIPKLKRIQWANPGLPEQAVPEWLRAGAPADRSRRLARG